MGRFHVLRSRAGLLILAAILIASVATASLVALARPGSNPVLTASAPTATPPPSATATFTPTPTPRPGLPLTPKHPTATPFPTGPNPPGNWMAVSVDYSYAGCHGGNDVKRAYPLVYLTNTYPNDYYVMVWYAFQPGSASYAYRGDNGGELVGGHTETVRTEPEYGPPDGPITLTLDTIEWPYSDVQGRWTGTIHQC